MSEEIKFNGEIYAVVGSINFNADNKSEWFGNSSDYIQVATMNYNKDKIFRCHKHNRYERSAYLTQEFIYCVEGIAEVTVYSDDKQFIDEIILNQYDFIVLYKGYHQLEILQDKTVLIETKNGPFASVEKDKVFFDGKK